MPPRVLLLAGLAAGCGGARPADPPHPVARPADECVLTAGDSAGDRPILVAATGGDTVLVDPRRSGTPVGLSCRGVPRPRLASSWSSDPSRRSWTLVVPSAGAVAAEWRERPRAAMTLRQAGVTSLLPLDDHRLVVSFDAPQPTLPGVLADPDLSVGTGDSTGLRLLHGLGSDLRDAIDGPADLVVTNDPAVVEYAAARGDRTARPLPWNRSYVLLVAAGYSPPLAIAPGDSVAFRAALARDAVRVVARGAEPPFWYETRPICPPRPRPGGRAASPGVAYPAGDATARALAERIVAMTSGAGLRVQAVAAGDFGEAIARGQWSAFVIPLPKVALVPCREIGGWPDGALAVPLVETRSTAIVRDGTPSLMVEYDGGIVRGARP